MLTFGFYNAPIKIQNNKMNNLKCKEVLSIIKQLSDNLKMEKDDLLVEVRKLMANSNYRIYNVETKSLKR